MTRAMSDASSRIVDLVRRGDLDRLEPLLAKAGAQSVPADELAYLRALRLREESRIEEALALALRLGYGDIFELEG